MKTHYQSAGRDKLEGCTNDESGAAGAEEACAASERGGDWAEGVMVRRTAAETGGGSVGGAATNGTAADGAGEGGERGFAAVSAAEAMTLELSGAQRTAIERLTCGSTMVDAATAAGVSRMTLYRWLKNDVQFQAAYNAWQRDAIATGRGRMLGITDAALASLGRALASGGDGGGYQPPSMAAVAQGRLALRVLEKMGIADRPSPGPTEAEDVEHEQEMERRKREVARYKEEDDVLGEEMRIADWYRRKKKQGKREDGVDGRREREGASE
jgi:hypothetical protein